MEKENFFAKTKNTVSNFFSKLTGNHDDEMHDDEYYYGEEDSYIEDEEDNEENSYIGEERRQSNERRMHISDAPRNARGAYKMQIVKPRSEEAATDILILLKSKNAVVVNMEYLDKEMAKNILHYISGGVFALDGKIEKVSNAIFLAVPNGFEISLYERTNRTNYDFGMKPWEKAN